MAIDPKLAALFEQRGVGVLVTLKRDGRPQLSNVSFHYDPGEQTIWVSVTDSRAKTANIRRDPRVSFHVSTNEGWEYAVAEGMGSLTPPAADPHDATVDALVEVYRSIGGEHPDWDEYRAAMVADRRIVLTINVERVYGLTR
jgi:uncharacterized protein